jgi:glutathione peroxidase
MQNYFKKIALLAAVCTLGACNPLETKHRPAQVAKMPNKTSEKMPEMPSIYNFSLTRTDGSALNLADYKGKKIIFLNVASECGYTPQYAEWEAFYRENKEKVVVLGLPCNQFGGQEPGTAQEIQSFCEKNYGVSFPITEKIDVKGSAQTPIYKWLSEKDQNGWCDKTPTWNFCKYLVNEKGELVDFFGSGVKPDNADFMKAVAQ